MNKIYDKKNLLILGAATIFSVVSLNCNSQNIITVAGTGVSGFSGNGGQATAAQLENPAGITFDAAGNIYILETIGNRIRMVNTSGIISTFAGNGVMGYSGDGGPATAAEINGATGLATDAVGNIYIADYENSRIRIINTSGIIHTVAGNGSFSYTGDGGPATASTLNYPTTLAVDTTGNLYFADSFNNVIREIYTSSGVIVTVVGNGVGGYSGDGGVATAAELSIPWGVCLDASGNIYIGDDNEVVRKVVTSQIISTIAGNGVNGYYGDGGPATAAEIRGANYLVVDNSGNLFIADYGNLRVREINTSGIISTFAGGSMTGFTNGEPATSAQISSPYQIEFDTHGNLYIADFDDQYVFMVNGYNCSNTYNEPVCIATVDTATNKAEVIWGRTNSPPAGGYGSYHIYKDTLSAFNLIHSQPLDSLSEYIDPTSFPSDGPESYEISTVDSCGESALSATHTTIYLTTSAGTNLYILNWTAYVGFTPTLYRIFRGPTLGSMVQIDSVPNTVLTFRDTLPPIGSYYAIEAVNPSGTCVPTRRALTSTLSGSFSNGFNTGTIVTATNEVKGESENVKVFRTRETGCLQYSGQ